MNLAISQTTGYLIVGCLSAVIPLGSAYLALRATRQSKEVDRTQQSIEIALTGQGDLITDLRTARDELKVEIADLKKSHTLVLAKLEECETERIALTRRVGNLEPGLQ